MSVPVTETELQAWVDGRLPAPRREAVDAYLALHPAEASRLQAYRQQNVALRARYNPVLDEALPAALATRPHGRLWRQLRRLGHWGASANDSAAAPWRHAAMLALTLAGGAAGWLLHDLETPGVARPAAAIAPSGVAVAAADGRALAQHAALAHAVYSPEQRHPVEVGADQQQHLVAWLSKRLGAPLQPPQLGALGYALIGGRLLPGESGPVAQFMYDNAGGQRLTLYVSTEQRHNRSTAFRFVQEGKVGVFYWIDGRYGYALSGVLDKAALARLADAVYVQLEPAG